MVVALRHWALIGSLVAWFSETAQATIGNNTCKEDAVEWYTSSVGETPCQTYEKLRQSCDVTYVIPSSSTTAPPDLCTDQLDLCCCNSIAFSLSMLCLNCLRGGGVLNDGFNAPVGSYQKYLDGCPSPVNGSLPTEVQQAVCRKDISIPEYLYQMDVDWYAAGNWSYLLMENEADLAIASGTNVSTECSSIVSSIGTASSSSSPSGTISSSTSSSAKFSSSTMASPTTSPRASSSRRKIPAGAIAGGIIAGLLALVGLIVAFFFCRSRRKNGHRGCGPLNIFAVGGSLAKIGRKRVSTPMTGPAFESTPFEYTRPVVPSRRTSRQVPPRLPSLTTVGPSIEPSRTDFSQSTPSHGRQPSGPASPGPAPVPTTPAAAVAAAARQTFRNNNPDLPLAADGRGVGMSALAAYVRRNASRAKRPANSSVDAVYTPSVPSNAATKSKASRSIFTVTNSTSASNSGNAKSTTNPSAPTTSSRPQEMSERTAEKGSSLPPLPPISPLPVPTTRRNPASKAKSPLVEVHTPSGGPSDTEADSPSERVRDSVLRRFDPRGMVRQVPAGPRAVSPQPPSPPPQVQTNVVPPSPALPETVTSPRGTFGGRTSLPSNFIRRGSVPSGARLRSSAQTSGGATAITQLFSPVSTYQTQTNSISPVSPSPISAGDSGVLLGGSGVTSTSGKASISAVAGWGAGTKAGTSPPVSFDVGSLDSRMSSPSFGQGRLSLSEVMGYDAASDAEPIPPPPPLPVSLPPPPPPPQLPGRTQPLVSSKTKPEDPELPGYVEPLGGSGVRDSKGRGVRFVVND